MYQMKGETSMKKIIMYRAFDGEDFFEEKDCRKYEADALNCMKEIFDKVQLFGDLGPLLAPAEDNVDKYMDVFDAAYDEASYMHIIERPSEAAVDFILGYMGRTLPDGVGVFKYDGHDDEWKAVE